MKRKILSLVVVVTLLIPIVSNANAFSGSSKTEFGKYTLTQSDNFVVINNVAYKSWALTYKGHEENFTLLSAPSPNGVCCITVKGENFEVVYKAEEGVFGVRLVDKENRTIKYKEVKKRLNKDQLAMQKVLTRNPKSEEEYLGLVACYLPLLLS